MPADGSSLLTLLRADLRAAWRTHRPYVGFSLLLFLSGAATGVLFWLAGREIRSLALGDLATLVLPQQFPATTLFFEQLELFSLLVLGALSAGVLTALALLAQGVVAGYFLALSAGSDTGLLVPAIFLSGLPTLFAYLLGAAVSFRLVVQAAGHFLGTHEPLDVDDWRQIGVVLGAGVLLLAVAAILEAYVLFALTELFS